MENIERRNYVTGDEAQWAKSIGEGKEDPEKKALNHSITKE